MKQGQADYVAGEATKDDLITPQQFADMAKASVPTIRRWGRQGIGPVPRRIGPRLVRYRADEVRQYLFGESGRQS